MSKEQVYQSMCDEGYVGDDCSKCAESHGKAGLQSFDLPQVSNITMEEPRVKISKRLFCL